MRPSLARFRRPSRHRPSSRRLLAPLLLTAMVVAGCADVPTNYNEMAEENFMVGCEDGSSADYCTCVWDELESTVPWDEFSKFDKDQQTADEENREIKIPAGIQEAIDKCLDGSSDDSNGSSTSTEQTTTTLG